MTASAPITVKVTSKTGDLPRQIPKSMVWEGVRYTFDAEVREYDWYVVYDDISAPQSLLKINHETLACPRANTILVTHEPSAVKTFGTDFTEQFGSVLSCHEEWALQHRNKTRTHPMSPWWYAGHLDYDALAAMPSPAKDKVLSTVCSTKQQKHTLHAQRYPFTRALKKLLPELEWYGHGVRPIRDKAEALDSFQYHIVIENHICDHYWTEKIADTFLAYSMPFYYGAPNIGSYFPEGSFIPFDISDVEGTAQLIRQTIADGTYEKNLPAIIRARELLLNRHNFFAEITAYIKAREANAADSKKTDKVEVIYNRRAIIKQNPLAGVRYLIKKFKNRLLSLKTHTTLAKQNRLPK